MTLAGRLVTLRPISRDDYPGQHRAGLLSLVAIAALAATATACGSGRPGPPAEGFQVFGGEQGWYIALPVHPVTAAPQDGTLIWVRRESGVNRVAVEILTEEGDSVESSNVETPDDAAEGWMNLAALYQGAPAGAYQVRVVDLDGSTLAQGAPLEVVE